MSRRPADPSKGVLHHLERLVRKVIGGELLGRDPGHRFRVGGRAGLPGHVGAEIIQDHVVVADRPLFPEDAVEDGEQLPRLDPEAGLLRHLAHQRLLEGFPELHRSSGYDPPSTERLLAPTNEEHPPAVDQHSALASIASGKKYTRAAIWPAAAGMGSPTK